MIDTREKKKEKNEANWGSDGKDIGLGLALQALASGGWWSESGERADTPPKSLSLLGSLALCFSSSPVYLRLMR